MSATARTALAIRHVSFEDLGVLRPLLVERGYSVRYLDAGIDAVLPQDVGSADVVVVLGGPIGVGDADRYPVVDEELRALEPRLKAHRPTLGICLGAQLIAHVYGAEVKPMLRAEVGYGPVTLTPAGRQSVLKGLEGVNILHWHGDQFSIPEGAEVLASTQRCRNQAFSLGPEVLGLQFHIEADHRRIEQWLIGHAVELVARGVDPRRIRSEADRFGLRLESAGREVFGAWLDGLE